MVIFPDIHNKDTRQPISLVSEGDKVLSRAMIQCSHNPTAKDNAQLTNCMLEVNSADETFTVLFLIFSEKKRL